MARIHKAKVYIVDFVDDIPEEDVKAYIEEHLEDISNLVTIENVESSEEFEWDDDLKINNVNSTVEDLKEYFPKKDTVTISKEEYDNLLERSELLSCLEACGVDNWSGYSDAQQMMEEEE